MCERCGRAVEAGRLWTLNVNVPPDGQIARHVCVVCAADVRRFVLAQPGSRYTPAEAVEETEPGRAARVGWFALRGIVYVAIAVGIFVVVTWLTSL